MSATLSIDPETMKALIGTEVLKLIGEQRNKLSEAIECLDGWQAYESVKTVVDAALREEAVRRLALPEVRAKLELAVQSAIETILAGIPDMIGDAMNGDKRHT
jgi:hypothetical protein